MGIDPMADAAGQQGLSPYHAMACNPSTMTDPLGLAPQYNATLSNPNVNQAPAGLAFVEGQAIMFGSSLLGGGVSDMMRSLSQTMDEAQHDKKVFELYRYLLSTTGSGNVGTLLPEVTTVATRLNWFQRTWNSIKSFVNSYQIEGSATVSLGLQAGVEVKTPIGGAGVEGNALSVELVSAKEKDILNGKDDGEFNYIGKNHWHVYKQSYGIDFIVGGTSYEKEFRSPVEGGAFFDEKVSEESKIFSYFRKKEYYTGGLQSQPQPTAPTYTNGIKFGAGFQLGIGIKVDFEIKRK